MGATGESERQRERARAALPRPRGPLRALLGWLGWLVGLAPPLRRRTRLSELGEQGLERGPLLLGQRHNRPRLGGAARLLVVESVDEEEATETLFEARMRRGLDVAHGLAEQRLHPVRLGLVRPRDPTARAAQAEHIREPERRPDLVERAQRGVAGSVGRGARGFGESADTLAHVVDQLRLHRHRAQRKRRHAAVRHTDAPVWPLIVPVSSQPIHQTLPGRYSNTI